MTNKTKLTNKLLNAEVWKPAGQFSDCGAITTYARHYIGRVVKITPAYIWIDEVHSNRVNKYKQSDNGTFYITGWSIRINEPYEFIEDKLVAFTLGKATK